MFLYHSSACHVTATATKIICICLYQAISWHIFVLKHIDVIVCCLINVHFNLRKSEALFTQHCRLTICIELVELTNSDIVSDDKIQVTILILRRGALSSTNTGYSQTSQDASQQSAENLPPQFRSPPRWHQPARRKTLWGPLLIITIIVLWGFF